MSGPAQKYEEGTTVHVRGRGKRKAAEGEVVGESVSPAGRVVYVDTGDVVLAVKDPDVEEIP